jgi:hypothetical protein
MQKDEVGGEDLNDMETGYRDDNGREQFTGRTLNGQRTVENFGNRKALKDATNWMMVMRLEWNVIS